MPHYWDPPSSFSVFSAADANHQIARLPTPETLGFPSTRLSPRQCAAEKLQIHQADCYSWSVDPFVNYLYQRLSQCTVPLGGHTWGTQWKSTSRLLILTNWKGSSATCHMRKGFANSCRWNAGAFELI